MESCLYRGLVALQVAAGVFQLGQILHLGALGLGQRDLEGARIDLCQQVAGLDHLAFLKGTSTSSPLTRLRTVTVL